MSPRDLARLVRLPALPTALADIALAALATGSLPARWEAFVLILLSSACLYLSGMAFNDLFDVEEDRRDRPERPLPSGQISVRVAGLLATALMLGGLLFAGLAGAMLVLREQATSAYGPLWLAGPLAAMILLYDAWLKHTPVGPLAMGACRFLNVLLGVSLSGSMAWPLGPHLALVVGIYITGVTLFARSEAGTSSPVPLIAGASIMLLGLALGLAVPIHLPLDTTSPLFPYLLVVVGFVLAFPLLKAIRSPLPRHVQAGVRKSLVGLILLDAVLATAAAGTIGLVILVLIVPALYLNGLRWLYAT